MLLNVMIAGVITFLIFIAVEFYNSMRQFIIFKKVRDALLLSTFNYLKKTPERMVDLNRLRNVLIERLQEIKLSPWVDDIKITWQSVDAIQFIFEFNFEKLKPKYKFIIGLKDVEEMLKRM